MGPKRWTDGHDRSRPRLCGCSERGSEATSAHPGPFSPRLARRQARLPCITPPVYAAGRETEIGIHCRRQESAACARGGGKCNSREIPASYFFPPRFHSSSFPSARPLQQQAAGVFRSPLVSCVMRVSPATDPATSCMNLTCSAPSVSHPQIAPPFSLLVCWPRCIPCTPPAIDLPILPPYAVGLRALVVRRG